MYPQEKQVCSLDQAKKLVELGAVLDTEKYWFDDLGGGWIVGDAEEIPYGDLGDRLCAHYPAPNVAELGILLPDIENGSSYRKGSKWYYGVNPEPFETEANARCSAYIWLIKNTDFQP